LIFTLYFFYNKYVCGDKTVLETNIFPNVKNKLRPYPKNDLTKKVDVIFNYDVLELGWLIKKWFRYDQTLLKEWYNDLLLNYDDWKWKYGEHKYMWKYDPLSQLGNDAHLENDTSWIMLTWGDNKVGPVPWLRTLVKDEYNAAMPRNTSESKLVKEPESLGARECFYGYAKQVIEEMSCGPHDIQVAIHTPNTKLPQHQDTPDKLRFHMPIITNTDARFIINGNDIHLPADGWCYLVNTSYLHSTHNKGNTDRVHIYGAVWTHNILDCDLTQCETVL